MTAVEILPAPGNAAPSPRRIPAVTTLLEGRRAGRGAVAGVLAGAIAVGVGQLVASMTGPGSSPVVAVGQLQIDFTPPAVKNFAISAFGSHDKLVLVGGILVVLAIFAAALGVLAMRRLAYGLAGLAFFAVVGVIAAATRPAATAADVLPALAAAAAGVIALVALIRAATPRTAGQAARKLARAGWPPGATGSAPVSALSPVGSAGSGGDQASSPTGPVVQQGRRRFLVVSGAAVGIAAVAGLGGRVLAQRSSVAGARRRCGSPRQPPAPPLPAGVDLHDPRPEPVHHPELAFYRVDTAIVCRRSRRPAGSCGSTAWSAGRSR